MKIAALSLYALLLCGATGTAARFQAPAPGATLPDLPQYLEVTPLLGTGGQPADAGLKALAEKGYSAVVNLRTAGEKVDLVAEEKRARELGMKYYSVPVAGSAPEERSAIEFLRVLNELNGEKVFVHCATANRVGSLVMIRRVLHDGLTVESAEAEAARIGLRSDVLLNFAREFIRTHR